MGFPNTPPSLRVANSLPSAEVFVFCTALLVHSSRMNSKQMKRVLLELLSKSWHLLLSLDFLLSRYWKQRNSMLTVTCSLLLGDWIFVAPDFLDQFYLSTLCILLQLCRNEGLNESCPDEFCHCHWLGLWHVRHVRYSTKQFRKKLWEKDMHAFAVTMYSNDYGISCALILKSYFQAQGRG